VTDHKFCVDQVERFTSLPGAPGRRAGIEEIVSALEDSTVSEAHARRVVDELVRSELRRWPTPGEVVRAAVSLRPSVSESLEKPAIECQACEDWGRVLEGGVWRRCFCEAGWMLEQAYLDLLNHPRKRPAPIPGNVKTLSRITESDIERAIRERREDRERREANERREREREREERRQENSEPPEAA
jgi:hypothetical protein